MRGADEKAARTFLKEDDYAHEEGESFEGEEEGSCEEEEHREEEEVSSSVSGVRLEAIH